ncbi:MAG: hypothetical protein WDN29_14705 [Methylovirgula sp.]
MNSVAKRCLSLTWGHFIGIAAGEQQGDEMTPCLPIKVEFHGNTTLGLADLGKRRLDFRWKAGAIPGRLRADVQSRS